MVQGDATQYYRKRNGIMVEHMVRPANFDMRYNHFHQEYEIYLLLREAGQFFVSTDGGKNFYQKQVKLSGIDFGSIDTANKTEIRVEAGKKGVIYIAAGENGLYKLIYNHAEDTTQLKKLSKPGDIVFRMGLGLGNRDGDYLKDRKALYICGVIDG